MNILFLHGLESKLSNPKREILEKFGTVTAPDIDYKLNSNTIELLYATYHDQNFDVIIGSSMGGFAGYYLSSMMNIPCLLYNPALPYRNNVVQIIPSNIEFQHILPVRIVLGSQDDVIKATDNLAFLSQNISDSSDYSIIIRKDLAHQIPISVFEQETIAFFDSLT